MNRYMLDTNIASAIIKQKSTEVRRRLSMHPVDSVVVSAVTQAELLYGLARVGRPAALSKLIREFLLRVQVLPWDSDAATVYGDFRATCASAGITLGALDMMIAAHAIAAKAVLVTRDKTFSLLPTDILAIEDWASES